MMLIREQDGARLIGRAAMIRLGAPFVVAAGLNLRQKHFVINGRVVVLDKAGVYDFDALPMAPASANTGSKLRTPRSRRKAGSGTSINRSG